MIKRILALFLLLTLLLNIVSCKADKNSQQNETTDETEQTTDNGETTPPDTDTEVPPEKELITGIELHTYPDPYRVREYEKLTDNQKIAYDAISEALLDITANGIDLEKTYKMKGRVSSFDFQLALDIINANFGSAENLISSIASKDSMGSQQYCDSIVMLVEDNYKKYFDKYNELIAEADEILKTIEHDGTDYGKALAIAKWMTDNIVYPADYMDRDDDYLNTAHTALLKREAICDGFAKAYDLLCKKAGLETIYVEGDVISSTALGHAWNMICISDKWYYVDVTWMNTSMDFYRNFMMPKSICDRVGHSEYSYYYYWDRENNKYILPEADSYDFYHTYFDSVEELKEYLAEQGEMYDRSVIVPLEIVEEVKLLHGTELQPKTNEKTFYISISDIIDTGFDEKAGVARVYVTVEEMKDTIGKTNEGSDVDGMVKAWYRPTKAAYNFDYSQERNVENFKINCCLPEHFVRTVEFENSRLYERFDGKSAGYVRCFEFIALYEVDEAFELDETVHSKAEAWNPYEGYDVIVSVGDEETDYVIYQKKTDEDFFAHVYVKLSEKYVLSFTYTDAIENYGYLTEIINSFKVN